MRHLEASIKLATVEKISIIIAGGTSARPLVHLVHIERASNHATMAITFEAPLS